MGARSYSCRIKEIDFIRSKYDRVVNDETGNARFKSWSHSVRDISHFTAKKETSPSTNGRINTISLNVVLPFVSILVAANLSMGWITILHTRLQYSLKIIYNR